MLRQERPQKGRYRQFWQFGVEAIGSPNPEQDAEVIALFHAIILALGIRKAVTLQINTLGDAETRLQHREALKQYLEPHLQDLSATSRQRFDTNPLRILDTKDPHERELLEDAPAIRDFLNAASDDHYRQVLELLDKLEIPYLQNDRLVRGLDYYTHTTFEFTCDALGAQDAICGGGRYDDLVAQLGGGRVPAIGWASGIERLLLVLENLDALQVEEGLDVFLILASPDLRPIAMTLVQEWRQSGIRCDLDMLRRSFKAQMREANRQQARFAAILGEDEYQGGQIQVKNLASGEQEAVKLSRVAEVLRRGQ